jgi:plasmid stabilization system protein ParE
MKVHLRRRAVIDLDEIYQYIAERNPRAARNVADAISDAIAQIAKFPMSAERASDPALASRSPEISV